MRIFRHVWVAIIPVALLAGCSSPGSDGTTPSANPSVGSSVPSASAEASGSQTLADLPFTIDAPSAATAQTDIINAESSAQASEGTDYRITGVTSGAQDAPTVKTILDDGSGFGSKLLKIPTPPVLDLAAMASESGIVNTDGSFSPLKDFAVQELPGSNPDGLYFDPQHASAWGDWVVWREASAGEAGAMPDLYSDDWRLVAWNRVDGTVRELASAFLLLDGERFAPYASWDVAPSTDGKTVYYEASIGKGEDWVNSIISVPLDKPGDVTVMGPGTMPVADTRDDGVFWVEKDTVHHSDGNKIFGVGSGWEIARLAGSDQLLVATVTDPSVEDPAAWLLVWSLAEERLVAAIDTGSDWAEASVSGDAFVWGNASGNGNAEMFYWRIGMDAPRILGNSPGLSVPMLNRDHAIVPNITEEGAVAWQFLELTIK